MSEGVDGLDPESHLLRCACLKVMLIPLLAVRASHGDAELFRVAWGDLDPALILLLVGIVRLTDIETPRAAALRLRFFTVAEVDA